MLHDVWTVPCACLSIPASCEKMEFYKIVKTRLKPIDNVESLWDNTDVAEIDG